MSWLAPEPEPLAAGSLAGDERAILSDHLAEARWTLRNLCAGLTAEQLVTASTPPSNLSLLGLVRHMAGVEHSWFYRRLRGHLDVPRIYRSEEDPDFDFNGVAPEAAVVENAFTTWREQIADADRWLDELTDLDAMVVLAPTAPKKEASVRDILIHMIEEYARHCGHADLLRECIDGRTGQ